MPDSMFPTYFTDMKCALDLLDQYDTLRKMSTGSAEIDSLIDGVQEGSFYLFYSSHENQLILDSFLYRQLIGCILPKSTKKNGLESAAIFLNNIDISYTPISSTRGQQQEQALINLGNLAENNALSSITK